MKTKLLFFGMMLSLNLTFSQANSNQSITSVNPAITQPIGPFSSEIFRFRSGLVTQIDLGNNFDLTATSPLNSRWFSIGRLNTGSQTVYGLRFQDRNKGLVFGYEDIANPNPRIQWIGTGAGLGNFEFRVANSFNSTVSTLVATMRSDGQTVFGSSTAAFNSTAKTRVLNEVISTIASSSGLNVDNSGSLNSNGIVSIARNGSQSNYGVLGITLGTAPFEVGVYGETNATNSNQWAGYFEGDVFSSGAIFQTSDRKLKENIKSEKSILGKISQLNPVNYNYKKNQS